VNTVKVSGLVLRPAFLPERNGPYQILCIIVMKWVINQTTPISIPATSAFIEPASSIYRVCPFKARDGPLSLKCN
jgi:hypothetical protein